MGIIRDELPLAGPGATHDVSSRAAQHPPERWSLLRQINAADPFDERETTIAPSGNDFGYTVYHARRGCMPTRIVLRGGGLAADAHILRRVDLGQETGVAERFSYEVIPPNGPDPGLRKEFNPTFGGSILKPDSSKSRQVRIFPSPPPHFLSRTGAPECPDGAWFEGAVVPLEFDSFGAEHANHYQLLGAAKTPGIYWRVRMFQRLTMNWRQAGTTDAILTRGVHEIFAASYFPREVRSSGDNSLPVVHALFNASLWLTDLFGTTGAWGMGTVGAEIFVPATNTSHDLNGTPPFYGPNAANLSWNGSTRQEIELTHYTKVKRTQPTLAENGPPYPGSEIPADGILAAILSNSNPGIAVGVVALLATDPLGLTRQNEFGLSQLRNTSEGLGYDKNNGQRISIRTRSRFSTAGRDAGWIAIRFLFVLKPTVQAVRDAILALRANGALGTFSTHLPMHYIPDHVRDGRYAPR